MDSGLGARPLDESRTFVRVWAPNFEKLDLLVIAPREQRFALSRDARGYHEALIEGIGPGAQYYFANPGGERFPDPASRYQPDGVHGPSQVIAAPSPARGIEWQPPALPDYVIYELHVGTFTPEGTFDSALARLPRLRELGVTAIELMPIAQFPGARNWGYDGVFPFAVQNTYGGPEALIRFIDACHQNRLAVILDVVYNHLGPEGNVLPRFGPYFNSGYRTPWGDALNFDAAHSDDARRFFIENARQWIFDYGFDALRLDAVHGILDTSAYPFLTELADTIHAEASAAGRRVYVIAESDLNDPRMIRPKERGGHGMDAQWLDDFHHSLHTLLTGESQGYYADFGELTQLAKSYREGFVYTGQYSPHRLRRHGASADTETFHQFVVAIQNHDQVGNRRLGDRLSAQVNFEAQKLAAAALLTAPFIPLLFMGEEYGELAPFAYFVSHSDPKLVEAVRAGRRKEFEGFQWRGEPPDPQAEATFRNSVLTEGLSNRSPHRELCAYYKHLLDLRREFRLGNTQPDGIETIVFEDDRVLLVLRPEHEPASVATVFCFNEQGANLDLPLPAGIWQQLSSSAFKCWAGPDQSLTNQIESNGTVKIQLAPWSAQIFTQTVRA
jgi:maltooligosyltrehalose trehalohydrolase